MIGTALECLRWLNRKDGCVDQVLIGNFLSDERKKKGYTQKQLADILIVSDKTISKWETGKSLPDLEMMNLICQTFGISINELLSGERISTAELESKSEENIRGLLWENENSRKANQWNMALGLGVLIMCPLLFGVSLWGMDLAKIIWYLDIPSLIAVVGVLIGLRLLSRSQSEDSFVERCIFPVGVMISIINMIYMLNLTTYDYLLKNTAVAILPMLYSSIIYIVLQCIKNRKKRR